MTTKTGLWLIGCQGGVATTVAVGLSALQRGATPSSGLVSQNEEFKNLDFVDWSQVVLGGHEIRNMSSVDAARQLVEVSRAIPPHLFELAKDDLAKLDENTRPGVVLNAGKTITGLADSQRCIECTTLAEAIAQVQSDLDDFKSQNGLDRVIVINLASTEPPATDTIPDSWAELSALIESNQVKLPPSSIYAIAAIKSGIPHVNFTPSLGTDLPALRELADQKKVCHMGRDGKTGETFLKSILAPGFAARNLDVMSWVGHNIFGNMDGVVLDDPENKETKVKSKDKLLGQILGYDPQTHVSIEYIKSLGDWKTAWDHIHFQGFLGTPMIMTFTWQGCDSILAAPLVLDLFKFTELAARRGMVGELTNLASFFKSPQGTEENDFGRQYQMLVDWSEKLA
jgi:myo-inositol-1-phosphate synthase